MIGKLRPHQIMNEIIESLYCTYHIEHHKYYLIHNRTRDLIRSILYHYIIPVPITYSNHFRIIINKYTRIKLLNPSFLLRLIIIWYRLKAVCFATRRHCTSAYTWLSETIGPQFWRNRQWHSWKPKRVERKVVFPNPRTHSSSFPCWECVYMDVSLSLNRWNWWNKAETEQQRFSDASKNCQPDLQHFVSYQPLVESWCY